LEECIKIIVEKMTLHSSPGNAATVCRRRGEICHLMSNFMRMLCTKNCRSLFIFDAFIRKIQRTVFLTHYVIVINVYWMYVELLLNCC